VEDLFSNPYSEIPDELWKTPSPMERQLAAVHYWAELTGVTKTAGRSSARDRIVDFLAKDSTPDYLAGATLAAIGAGETLYGQGKKPQGKEVQVSRRERTSSPTREQISLMADRASLEKQRSLGRSSRVRDDVQNLKEDIAALKAKNPLLATALMGGIAGGTGFGLSRYLRKAK
jgi:hypothetical protein